LADLEKAERQASEADQTPAPARLTFGGALELLRQQADTATLLKPSTRKYQSEIAAAVRRTWPGLDQRPVKEISALECKTWAAKFSQGYSPTRYNAAVGLLRAVFATAIHSGSARPGMSPGPTATSTTVARWLGHKDRGALAMRVLEGHLAVDGSTGKYPEFKGNVATCLATLYTHPMAQGGSGNGHSGGKAEVYMDVGEAMGQARSACMMSLSTATRVELSLRRSRPNAKDGRSSWSIPPAFSAA
jgi:hypothetical protein